MSATHTFHALLDGPIGELLLTSDGSALTGLYMDPHKWGPSRDETGRRDDALAPLAQAREQLAAYFSGEARSARRSVTPRSPGGPARPARRGRSGRRWGVTRCRSSSPVTGSSAPTAA